MRPFPDRAAGVLAVLAAAIGAVFALASEPVAADMRIEVESAPQLVSLEGSNPSLRLVLEELSWRAGFELRAFGIEDRAVSARIERAPVSDALRRLLGRDPYLIGVATRPGGPARIEWVEVPGPAAGARRPPGPRAAAAPAPGGIASAAAGVAQANVAACPPTCAPGAAADPSPATQFRIPPGIFLAAFDDDREVEREAALRAIASQLDDEAQRHAFLRTDSTVLADAVAPYRHASSSLQALAAGASDPELRHKLEEVMGLLYAAVERAPAAYTPSPSPLAEFFE